MGMGLKLFGVRILRPGEGEQEDGMRKSNSMGNLATCMAPERTTSTGDHGYLSDGLLQSSKRERSHMRKKGVPWTEEEHKAFLAGLKTLGKGDWRGISRKFVKTKTPTQVASHAQKYFLRQTAPSAKKRRSSLFDVEMNDTSETSKIAPTLSMAKISNTSEEINLLQHGNYLISIRNNTQAAAQSFEAFPILSSTCGLVSNFHGLSYREEISSDETNQPFVRHSDVLQTLNLCTWTDRIPHRIHDYAPCAPDLLQPSFNPLPHTPPPSLPRWIEINNLELTIAPPSAS